MTAATQSPKPVRAVRHGCFISFGWKDERGQWWTVVPAGGLKRMEREPDNADETEQEYDW